MKQQKNDKLIYLPNAEQSARLLENAWVEFINQAYEAGYCISKESAGGWLKDAFAAGYALGYNDCLGIIKGQLEVTALAQDIMQQ